MSRRIGVLGCLVVAAALVGCAGASPGMAEDSSSPTPSYACPLVEGVELPPECAPYDPEAAMAENDRYRERMELSEDAAAAGEELAAPLRTQLEEVRTSGTITADVVTRTIEDAGLPQPQFREEGGIVLFGVTAPDGGCLFGTVSPEAVTVEVGGYIMDGGCLPAQ